MGKTAAALVGTAVVGFVPSVAVGFAGLAHVLFVCLLGLEMGMGCVDVRRRLYWFIAEEDRY